MLVQLQITCIYWILRFSQEFYLLLQLQCQYVWKCQLLRFWLDCTLPERSLFGIQCGRRTQHNTTQNSSIAEQYLCEELLAKICIPNKHCSINGTRNTPICYWWVFEWVTDEFLQCIFQSWVNEWMSEHTLIIKKIITNNKTSFKRNEDEEKQH